MSVILVPYHLDEHLPNLDVPLPPDTKVFTVVEPLPVSTVWTRLAFLYGSVADVVTRTARAGEMATVLSGDCTTSLATMAGLQHAGVDASLVWFDSHGDVQTLETTSSGYIGGMPLRMLVGYRPELLADRLNLHAIAEERVVLVDARELDPPEVEYLATAGIRRCGVDELTESLLPDGPLMVHLDLDVVDSDELPGLRYPAGSGPSTSAVLDAVRRLLDTDRVAAISIGCTWYDGPRDPTGVRSRVLSSLVHDPKTLRRPSRE